MEVLNWTVGEFVIDKDTNLYFQMSALHHDIQFQTQLQSDKYVFPIRSHISVNLHLFTNAQHNFVDYCLLSMVSSDWVGIGKSKWQIVWENIVNMRLNDRVQNMHSSRRRQQLNISENDRHFMKPKAPLLWSTRNKTSINTQTVVVTVHSSRTAVRYPV
jgi:hypothetical protein